MSVCITGIGAVSPYGAGRELLWNSVVEGKSALRPISRFDASQYRNVLGGEVPDWVSGDMERAGSFAVVAAKEAAMDAQLGQGLSRVGLVLASNFGGTECAEISFRNKIEGKSGPENLEDYFSDSVLAAVRKAVPSEGPQAMLSLACASGAAAIGTALEWLRAGRCDAALAGGFDELSETSVAGLSALRAISKDTIRPFDKDRGGTIFSEGSAMLVLETEEHAKARGARVYAKILGRGINNDAFHMTAPEKTGKGIVAVMQMALADAKLKPEDIDHLNLHGTGTKYNDLIETTAIKTVFGSHTGEMLFTANKSLFGHAMGAAGSLEAAVACLSVARGMIPPTMNCQERDPELDLDCCFDKAKETKIRYAMTNSYGLGGTNASLVLAGIEVD